MNEEYVKSLEKRLDHLEKTKSDIENRITGLERKSDVSSEQIKMIFNILNEIKNSISCISNKLDKLEQEPSKQATQIKIAIVTAITSGVIGVIIGLIFNK